MVNQDIGIRQIMQCIDSSEARRVLVPVDAVMGWPYYTLKHGVLCATVPFYGRRIENKQVYLYPISHIMTMTLVDGRMIEYSNLYYSREFKDVDFSVSCGRFRHKAIEHMTREEYEMTREKLFDLYDELLICLRAGKGFARQAEMKACFALMMEPGELPMYERLAPRFFQNYCGL